MQTRDVHIPVGEIVLEGSLSIPAKPHGIVVFVHGSGSSRLSPRNRDVALALQREQLATLLFDLLTLDEHRRDAVTAEYRFDIPFLTRRLVRVLDWLALQPALGELPVGLFGASTGAAAALAAAADRRDVVRAVVSRGGRPDLAGDALARVASPVLLIVGERDEEVYRLNRQAAQRLDDKTSIVLVQGATHLFEEPGALEKVAQLAADWFVSHLDGSQLERRGGTHDG